MNTIKELFFSHTENIVHKWHHYLDIYDKWFYPYKNNPINLLEIGVSHGGSLQMWKKYFHDESNIVGIEINPKAMEMEKDNIKIIIGDQSDVNLLEAIPFQFDIIIDDGSHIQSHIITSFTSLWNKLKVGGIYLIEDLHTSYWDEFGGSLKGYDSSIEFYKGLIDYLNGHHVRTPGYLNKWTNEIGGIHFYDSMVIVEKKTNEIPVHTQQGSIRI